MKKLLTTALSITIFGSASYAQEAKDNANDIWYVWIDTTTGANGQTSRILSKQAFKIGCCVKSPKYRKLLKKTTKWIRNDVENNYNGDSPLSKIQDADLAATMIKEASEQNGKSSKLIMVDYLEKCE